MAYGTPQGRQLGRRRAPRAPRAPTRSAGRCRACRARVVLQDNGGDDLSVSANGAFTFATALANGAAYAVTVKTNPTGQTCTVTNGAGTIGTANVTNVAVTCTTAGGTGTVTDDFNRANGGLGPNWTAMTDGGMAISSQVVVGTELAATRVTSAPARPTPATSPRRSQVTSTQLSGGQWIGPAVRAQNGGQNLYLGLYWWNNGSPVLMLFKRTSGNWTQLGSSYAVGRAGRGHPADSSPPAAPPSRSRRERRRAHQRHRHHLDRGRPGDHGLRHPQGDNWVGAAPRGDRDAPTRSAARSRASPARSCSRTTAATT